MVMQTFGLTPERVGITRARILKNALPRITLGTIGENDNFDKNSGRVMKFRRYLADGQTASQPNRFFPDGAGDRAQAFANSYLASEGVTPPAGSISSQDITTTLNHYTILKGYTKDTFDMYEDDIPKQMTEKVGQTIGLVNEMVLFGVAKGCTNRFYGGTGVDRATVNDAISLPLLRRIARSLAANHAVTVTKMLQKMPASGNYATSPIEGACFPVFVSTDLHPDIRNLPGFLHVKSYSDGSKALPNEFGACEEFRFFSSPELIGVQSGGAAVTTCLRDLQSTDGVNADVYQVIVASQDAWTHVGLNLSDDSISALPPGQKDKADPTGVRGFVGADWYYNAALLNQLQMAVVEVGTDALKHA